MAHCLCQGSKTRDVETELLHVARRTHRHLAPGNDSTGTETGQGFKIRRFCNHVTIFRRCLDDGRGDRMLGAAFDGGHERQHFVPVESCCRHKVGEFRMARGQRSGLVDSHDGRVAQRLQRLALAEQDAEFGCPSRPHHDRGWRCKSHGAGTGNDQHGHGIDESEGECRPRSEQIPGNEGDEGRSHHRRHEPRRDAINQRLDRQFRALRRFDHADDLGQQRIGADPGGAIGKASGLVDGATHHLQPNALGYRHRFTGDHRFIDERCAGDDNAVNRQPLTGAHPQNIALSDIADRDFRQNAIALDMRGLGLQSHQPGNSGTRPALGPGFEIAAEQDQRNDDGRCLEIDIHCAFRQHGGKKRGDGGVAPCRAGTQHDQ